MGNIPLKEIFITIVLVVLFVVGFTSFLNVFSSYEGYNGTLTQDENLTAFYTSVNSTFSDTDVNIRGLQDDIENKTEKAENPTLSEIFPSASLIGSAIWAAIKMPFQALTIVQTMLSAVTKYTGIPPFIQVVLMSIIIFTIVFAVIRAIRGGEV